jgi:hypothetical protein
VTITTKTKVAYAIQVCQLITRSFVSSDLTPADWDGDVSFGSSCVKPS